jgi:hypothetical protein
MNSYINNQKVDITNQPVNLQPLSFDAFGRFRVSEPFTLFDSFNRFMKNSKFTEFTQNSATIAFNSTDCVVDLTVATGQTNSMAIRESKNVFSYQPGKSLLILNTFAFADMSANNLIQSIGYYTHYGSVSYTAPYAPKNGIYLEASGNQLYICKANNSTVTKVVQSDWNKYTFLNNKPYDINLDVTKAQIFWIDIEWLGVGSVRTGFVINGQFILAHQFNHANIESTTYMQTACLPVRAGIINTTTGPGGIMKYICSSVISEGGYENTGLIRHYGNGINLKNVSTGDSQLDIPFVTIRSKTGRFDSIIIPTQLSVMSTSNDNLAWKIILNADVSGTSYVSGGTDSNIEYDISGTSITGGTEINYGYLPRGDVINLSSAKDFNLQLGKYFTINPITYNSDTLTICLSNTVSGSYTAGVLLGAYDIVK